MDIIKHVESFLICERCTSRADSNCETILKMRSNNCCRIFDKEVPFWTSAFKATTPKFSCPLKKGHYQIRDAPLSIKDSIEPLLSGLDRIEDFYWKIKFQLFSNPDKEELYCVKGGGKIVSFKDS